ncbi:MAG: DUF484 family protein [Proteobacteria bacterium]|nr:DUF484 family protein [Pseudomonadota bacterium]
MPQNPSGGAAKTAAQPLTAEQIVEFLREHPDFLNERPEALDALAPPRRWSGDRVVDMQRALIERQRARIDRLDTYARDLIATGRANLSNQSRTNAAALAMMAATGLGHLIETVGTDLPLELDLDAAALSFERDDGPLGALAGVAVGWIEPGTVDMLIGHAREVVLRADVLGRPEIFGEAASLVRSEALCRLRPLSGAPAGLLALGSRRPTTFHSGQGTENVSFLARVFELCLRRWLKG